MAMVQDTPGARAPGKISGVETSKSLLFRLNPGIKGRLMRTPDQRKCSSSSCLFHRLNGGFFFLFLEKKNGKKSVPLLPSEEELVNF